MNCPRCNAPTAAGTPFCAQCGLPMQGQQQQQGAAPFPPPPGPPGAMPPGMMPPPYPPPGPYGFPPGGAYGYPPPPMMAPRTSGNAVAGFVLSFFCGLLGLIFSIIGYNECKSSRGALTGEGLALAGIIISILSILIGIAMVGSGNRWQMYRDDHAAAVALLESTQRDLATAQRDKQVDQQRIAQLTAQLHYAQQQLARLAPYAYHHAHYPPRAGTVLTLGILSIVVCSFLGPIAWSMGNEELRRIDSGMTTPEGRSNVVAGKVLGIVSSCLLMLGAFAFFVMIALAAGSH